VVVYPFLVDTTRLFSSQGLLWHGPNYQNLYLWLLMTTGSAVLWRMASDSATDKASGLGMRKGNTSLRGSKDGILGTEDDERERVL
jgi:hypothetical protein